MPELSLSPDVMSKLGLDSRKPGDVIFAPAKLVLEGDGDIVSGVRVQGLAELSDEPTEGAVFTDLYDAEGSPAEESGESPEEANAEGDSGNPGEEAGTPDLSEDSALSRKMSEKMGDAEPSSDGLPPVRPNENSAPLPDDDLVTEDAAAEDAAKKEEKILGYRRPKAKKAPMPSAKFLHE